MCILYHIVIVYWKIIIILPILLTDKSTHFLYGISVFRIKIYIYMTKNYQYCYLLNLDLILNLINIKYKAGFIILL